MWMKVDQMWVVQQAPHRRSCKVDELVVRLIKYKKKSVFPTNLKLLIDDLVACEKTRISLSFPNRTPDRFILHANMSPAVPDVDKNSVPF